MPDSNLTDEEFVELFNSMKFPVRCHKDTLFDHTAAVKHVTGFKCYIRQVANNSEYYDLTIITEGE